MPFSFVGKKILVTGAGRGIGRNLAKVISKSGGAVYALGRTKENIKTLAEECDNIHPVIADLSNWEQTRDAVNRLDAIDGVVNNAVYMANYNFFHNSLTISKEVVDEAVKVNLFAPINIIQVTARKMIDEGKRGSIVNVSSIYGLRPSKDMLFYTVTKAGLDMVTKQFAVELGCHQIRVNSVQPTFVATERVMDAFKDWPEFEKAIKQQTPMGRFSETEECIDPILYLLSDHSSMVTGTNNVVDGGILASLPF